MNQKKKLTEKDIIGRKVVCVYEMALERVGKSQNGLTIVRLDSRTIFNLDALRDPKKDEPLSIWSCGLEKGFVPVLSIERDPNLDSPIKAIVFAAHFVNGTAILLENEFVLTINIGEHSMGHAFYLPSDQYRNYVTMKIAD